MILEICAIVFTCIFAFAVVYLILTLKDLRVTLKRVDYIALDVEDKLQSLDSSFNVVSMLGDVAEKKVSGMKVNDHTEHAETRNTQSRDIAEWLVLSLKLGEKFLHRR